MIVFLNGKFVPEEEAVISVFDRSFSLSDGLYEVLPLYQGKMFLWEKHFARFETGANVLKIKIPFSQDALRDFAGQLMRQNGMSDGILRMQLSRGVGPRGYSVRGADSPAVVMSVHPARKNSSPARIITSSIRIPANDPLSRFKSCNKLLHVLARMEADEVAADEALLLDPDGNVAEATSANIFWFERETVCTPPLETSALPGVTRAAVLGLCNKLGMNVVEKKIAPRDLAQRDGVFLTSVAVELWEVSDLDGKQLGRSPLTQTLREAYLDFIKESAGRPPG
ncbi:MAG: aminotransferase class IV [Verrucomicrobiota bacterium]